MLCVLANQKLCGARVDLAASAVYFVIHNYFTFVLYIMAL